MFQKVVVAVDGSEESRKAAVLAQALAGQFRSEVLVLHVRETAFSGASAWSPEWTPELEAFMADVVNGLERDDLQGTTEVRDAPKGHAGRRSRIRLSRWEPISSSWGARDGRGWPASCWERGGEGGPVRALPGPGGPIADPAPGAGRSEQVRTSLVDLLPKGGLRAPSP